MKESSLYMEFTVHAISLCAAARGGMEIIVSENIFKAEIGDTRVTAIVFGEAFSMKNTNDRKAVAGLKNLHQHSTYEVFFGGNISITTENETAEYENSLIIIPPYLNHYTNVGDGEVYTMYFATAKSTKRQGILFDALNERLLPGITVLPMTDDEEFYVKHIDKCISNDDVLHFIALLFSEIFARVAPKAENKTEADSKREKYIKKIDVYLAEHYCENIKLSELSRELYLCEKQISRIIAREYGCSLSELVTRRRLSVSCMLLKYTTMSVGEVARQVGYANESYFFSVFRRAFGVTPREYRKSGTSSK